MTARAAVGLGLGLAGAGCTTLGPTPATTGFTAQPAGRPDVAAQAAIVPGHYLSSAVTEDPKGAGIGQGAISFEPDRLLRLPGLVIGARLFGQRGDMLVEPVLGYRRTLGDGGISIGVFAFGTHASASADGASYEATRLGGELATDLRITRPDRWAELHLFGGAAVTGLSVDGDYCIDDAGKYGVQCPDDGTGTKRSSHASGAYPALHVGVAGAFLQHRPGWFHGVRLSAMIAGGAMPRVIQAEQTDASAYFSVGLAAQAAIGGR